MDIQTISMDPRIAAIHYKDYRKKVREHRALRLKEAEKKILEGGRTIRAGRTERSLIEKEDEALMFSYREMAKGQRVLNVASVMKSLGLDPVKQLPVLAIAQADWPRVHFRTDRPRVFFASEHWASWDHRYGRYKKGALHFPWDTFRAELYDEEWRKQHNKPRVQNLVALVPAIPAHLRPAGDLSGYHILFEARWTHEAPPDPLLLKHVSGYIYTVVAQWDLTPIEKAILEGRGS